MAELTLEEYEKLNPKFEITHDGKKMVFSTPSTWTLYRATSIYEKEPCTLDWINGFHPDDILIDIGANVGMYSIWAAATKKVKVFSFEPEARNYSLLNKNIMMNELQINNRAFCAAIGEENSLSSFFMSDLRVGGSCNSAGEALGFDLSPLEYKFSQGCIIFTLDSLIEKKFIEMPNHIKIDVDGFEFKVINGGLNTLENKNVKSLLIEINPKLKEHIKMISDLENLGFKYDPIQVKRAERKTGSFKGCAEYVFIR